MDFPPAKQSKRITDHLQNTEVDFMKSIIDAPQTPRISDMADAMAMALAKNRSLDDQDPDPYGFGQELEQTHAVDILEPEWKAAPDDSRWNKRIQARARKALVAKFYRDGFSVSEIARRVNTTELLVHQDLDHIAEEWRKSALADVELVVAKDLARMDYYMSRLAPAIDVGDVKAIMAALEIIKERGAILGTRTGIKVDIEQHIRAVAEANGFSGDRAVEFAQRILVTMK